LVSDDVRYTEVDALIDTGAQRTVVSPEVVRRAGLSKINEAEIRGVGGTVKAAVYVASLQFPKCGLRTIEVIEVSCCKLPTYPILYDCLLGRDVLSRWILNYDGPTGSWEIREEAGAPWVEPPEGFDPNLWGEG
jgi:predicted aspartyl protease